MWKWQTTSEIWQQIVINYCRRGLDLGKETGDGADNFGWRRSCEFTFIINLEHSPCSPDLDYWLFPKNKAAIKESRLSDVSDIQRPWYRRHSRKRVPEMLWTVTSSSNKSVSRSMGSILKGIIIIIICKYVNKVFINSFRDFFCGTSYIWSPTKIGRW